MKIAFWSNANDKCMVSANLAAIAVASIIRYPYSIITMENRLCNNNLGQAFYSNTYIHSLYEVGTNYYDGGGMEGLMRKLYRGDYPEGSLEPYITEIIKEHLYYIPQSKVIHGEVFDYELNCCIHPMLKMLEDFADICMIDTASHRNLNTKTILEEADLIVVNLCQNRDILEDFFLNHSSIISKCVFIISNYVPNYLYHLKNIANMYSVSSEVVTAIPYNKAFLEAFQQGSVVEFISRNYSSEKGNPNYLLMQSIKKAAYIVIKKAVEQRKRKEQKEQKEQKEKDMCLLSR